jgi:hypothetical protein
MNAPSTDLPRELLRRVRAHSYRTRAERLARVNTGLSVLDDYTQDEVRAVLPGRKVEWITQYGTARNAVVHADPERIEFSPNGKNVMFNGTDGKMYTVAVEFFFTVSPKRIFHKIRAPRKVR